MQSQPPESPHLSMSSPGLMNPGMPMGSYAPPLPGAVDAGDIPQEGDWGREPIVDGSKLYKGVLWALLIEGIVAFLLYAAWWLCHPRK